MGLLLQLVLLLAWFLYPPVPRRRSGSLLGDLVDSDVHKDHDDARQEKRPDGRGNNVPFFSVYITDVPLLLLHGYKRREGDHGSNDPNNNNDALDSLRCALEVVLNGLRDRPVPVQTNGAQVSDRGRAEENVQGQVDFTPHLPEGPEAHQLIRQRERHHQSGHQYVSGGQRDQEQVLGSPERSAREHGDDHQHIAEDDEEDKKPHQNAQRKGH